MGMYTVVLTVEQETCLLYEVERTNARRALQTDKAGKTLTTLLSTEVLLEIVATHLATVQRNMDATLPITIAALRVLDRDTQNKIIASLGSRAEKDRITFLLQG